MDITLEKQMELLCTMVTAGFTDDDIKRIMGERKDLLFKLYGDLHPSPSMPWYVSPDKQLKKARQLWPHLTLPTPPRTFRPIVPGEVPLIHIPDTFNSLWNKVCVPPGYTKCCQKGIRTDREDLQLTPGKYEFAEPVWVGFNPEYGKGVQPKLLLGEPHLAASEVLSALIQFPNWSLSWFNGASTPCLTGYQFRRTNVLRLIRWRDSHEVGLTYEWADHRDEEMASPSVRELC